MLNRNLTMLATVASGLRDLREEVVFVGGAVVDLYIRDPAAPPLRTTEDVDCVIELAGRAGWRALERRLLLLGFEHPVGEAVPVCRWRYHGMSVDVMPDDPAILGFSNRWYGEGIAHAERALLPDGTTVRILTLPYFIASKLEAFAGRGDGDHFASPDVEDVLAVLDGAPNALALLLAAPPGLRGHLRAAFSALLDSEDFRESVFGHLRGPYGDARAVRALRLLADARDAL